MSDPINRRLRILQMLPREGDKEPGLTVQDIIHWLESEYGMHETVRNIQRDLRELQDEENAGFPISCNEDSKPYRWQWHGKDEIGIPRMGRHTALALQLAEKLLVPILPKDSFEHLRPSFTAANSLLDRRSELKAKRWLDKVRIVRREMPLIPPEVQPGVFECITQALYEDKLIKLTYTSANNTTGSPKSYSVHPYALLHRGTISELVGRIDGKEKPGRFLLHRVKGVEMQNEPSQIPSSFNLDSFIQEKLGYPSSGQEIQFKARVCSDAIHHVTETRLSEDQILEETDDGVIITAHIRETVELKWWILGLGDRIQVLEPKSLREDIKTTAFSMAEIYLPS